MCDFWEINFTTRARAPWPSLPALQPAVWNKEALVCPQLSSCVSSRLLCAAGLGQLRGSWVSCSRVGWVLPAGHGGEGGAGRQEEGDVFACCSCLRCSSNTAAKPRQLFQSPLLSATPEAALGHPPGVPAQRSKPSSMGMRLKF